MSVSSAAVAPGCPSHAGRILQVAAGFTTAPRTARQASHMPRSQPPARVSPPQDGDHHAVAVRTLSRRDPRFARLVRGVGSYAPRLTASPFQALIGAIVHQQVSMAAAATIRARLRGACPRGRISPRAILALDEAALRGVGLSRQKAGYVRNVAERFASGELSKPKLQRMSDEEVIATTTSIKGVGRWTAEMLLIFCLARPDVWPADDLGLRNAVQRYFELAEPPSAKQVAPLGDAFAPYRTVATWYLWRSLENPVPPSIA